MPAKRVVDMNPRGMRKMCGRQVGGCSRKCPAYYEHPTTPQGMTEKECKDLPVFSDGEFCVSCWHMSLWERLRALFLGKIWISIWSGHTQPPILITTEKPLED